MGKEIERKFLVNATNYREKSSKTFYKQGYLSVDKERTVRVRIVDSKGYITIKGRNIGCMRSEYEYEIPVKDAEEILNNLCLKPIIEKYRYIYTHTDNNIWEIDEFMGENAGLTVAEIELPAENYPFVKPNWIGQEVTGDVRFYNSNLIKCPFKQWENKDLFGKK